MSQDFTAMTAKQVVAAVADNIFARTKLETIEFLKKAGVNTPAQGSAEAAAVKNRVREHKEVVEILSRIGEKKHVVVVADQKLHELADYIGTNPERHAQLVGYLVHEPLIGLAGAGAATQELCALLVAHDQN